MRQWSKDLRKVRGWPGMGKELSRKWKQATQSSWCIWWTAKPSVWLGFRGSGRVAGDEIWEEMGSRAVDDTQLCSLSQTIRRTLCIYRGGGQEKLLLLLSLLVWLIDWSLWCCDWSWCGCFHAQVPAGEGFWLPPSPTSLCRCNPTPLKALILVMETVKVTAGMVHLLLSGCMH